MIVMVILQMLNEQFFMMAFLMAMAMTLVVDATVQLISEEKLKTDV